MTLAERLRLADQVGLRLLHERERAREAGDCLGAAVHDYLNEPAPGPEDLERLREALEAYCEKEGWGGPAMKFTKERKH